MTDTPAEDDDAPSMPQMARSRAVFSTEDFALLKEAVAFYLKEVQDQPISVKYSSLYHRLGRLGR